MSEREHQIAILNRLALHENEPELHRLQQAIAEAEKEEKTVRHTAGFVAVIGLASAWFMGYSAIFVDNFFKIASNLPAQFLSVLSLGSLICLVAYLIYWCWHRAQTNRLYRRVSNLLLSITETRFQSIRRQFEPVIVPNQDTPDQASYSSSAQAA
jgi:hypothetical protein